MFGRVGSGSGEFQLLEHPACAVHEEPIRHEHRIIPGGEVHHPALAVYPAQNADGEAGVPHGPRPPAVDEKARCGPGLEQPGGAGVEVHADEVQRRAALLVALEGQRHIDQPRRQFRCEPGLQQPGRQFGGKAAVHSGGAAGAHPVTEDHLSRRRAAELLNCVAGDRPPRGAGRKAEDGPQRGLFGEEQGSHSLAGEDLRRLEGAAAEPPDLLRQGRKLGGSKAGAGQGDRRPRPAKVVQRDGAFQRRGAEARKEVRHPPGFVGFRIAGAAKLLAEHPQRIGHGAVLLR